MEVPVTSRISDLELSSMSPLHNPSLVSIPMIGKVDKAFIFFWKWNNALCIALFLATLISNFYTRIKLIIVNYRRNQSKSQYADVLFSNVDFDNLSDLQDELDGEEEDDDTSVSSDDDTSASSDDEITEEEDERGNRDESEQEEKIQSKLRAREFSWSDFAKGKMSVVKIWDGIELGSDLNLQSSGSLISIYDLKRDQMLFSSVFAAWDDDSRSSGNQQQGLPSSVVAKWRPERQIGGAVAVEA